MFSRLRNRLALFVLCVPLHALGSTNCITGTYSNPRTICVVTDAFGTFNTNNDVTYAWDSTVPTNKGLTISFSCTSGYAGFTFTVKDEIGTAGARPIVVTAQSSDTIDAPGAGTGHNAFVLNSNYESLTFQCDGAGNTSGAGNWLVQ